MGPEALVLDVYWDHGVRWHLEQVEAPDLTKDPLTLAMIKDQIRRPQAWTTEDAYLDRLRKNSYRMAERATWRPLIPQEWALVMDRFTCSFIEIPKAPLLSVSAITYIDADGVEQTLAGGSPATFDVTAPPGPQAGRGNVRPLYGEVWPTARYQRDAVRITFSAGYPLLTGADDVADIPEDITHGRLLVITEMYEQRQESVTGVQTPALIRARDLWLGYRSY